MEYDDMSSDGGSTRQGSILSKGHDSELEAQVQGDLAPPLQQRLFTRFIRNKNVPSIPLDSERTTLPMNTTNIFSRIFLTWLIPLMNVGYMRTITQQDMWKLGDDISTNHKYDAYKKHLDAIIKKAKTNDPDSDDWPKNALYFAVIRTFKRELTWSVLLKAIDSIFTVLVSLLMKYLIISIQDYSEQGDDSAIRRGIGWSFGVSLFLAVSIITRQHAFLLANNVGGQIRAVLTKALLDKSMVLAPDAKHEFPSSTVLSYLGVDVARIQEGVRLICFYPAAPVAVAIAIALLIINLRASALAGIAVFFLTTIGVVFPVQLFSKYRGMANKFTDKRASIMRQILQSMKIIKFYGWEDAYEKLGTSVRAEEMVWVNKIQFAFSMMFSTVISTISFTTLCAILVAYGANGMGQAAAVFSSLTLFEALTSELSTAAYALPQTIDGARSATRILKFLQSKEIQEQHPSRDVVSRNALKGDALKLDNASFGWLEFEDVEEPAPIPKQTTLQKLLRKKPQTPPPIKTTTSHTKTIIKPVTLSIKSGEFIVVTGLTGSGKSTFLGGLSGLVDSIEGSMTIAGSLLHCSDPMVLSATIKENILFGSQYDSVRYHNTLRVCALVDDLKILPAGDMTEVGERGVTLSGGQKARVNLARAVYADWDIGVFDDVISAVDANVGKIIIDQCMLGWLKDKTRVLATHNLAVIPKADRIIFVNMDGTVDIGTFEELHSRNEEFVSLMEHKKDAVERPRDWAEDFIDPVEEPPAPSKKTDLAKLGALVQDEERALNSIPLSLYYNFFVAGLDGWRVMILPLAAISLVLSTFTGIFANVWLAFWIEQHFGNKVSSTGYILGYVFFNVTYTLTMGAFFFALGYLVARSSMVINLKALHSVLHTPMSFLDSTPIGRVLNRFTKDVNTVDNEVTENVKVGFYHLAQTFGILILATVYIPWFAISIPFLVIIFAVIAHYYQTTNREVKRLESIQQSKVLNNFNEVMNGLTTIRAYKSSSRFIEKNDTLLDSVMEVVFVNNCLNKWNALAVGLMSAGVTLLVTLLSSGRVFGLNPSSVALLTTYMIQFSELVSHLMIMITNIENSMNSVERIMHYATGLDQEASYKTDDAPLVDWPSKGEIKFKKASLRYRDGLPLILKNLSFEVGEFEKIGICGRTGAGKSSLMTALFRISELESGSIEIDGVDISKIGLFNLRSKMSIIPQDPVLFKGTIRHNLDPFDEKTDDELWDALERADLSSRDGEKDSKFHLDAVVEDEGGNYSLGERQLIALTRALVRHSKILVMDEATSSVDYETDALVQKTIAREFKDCTILCIAHRLKTILKYDRVLVMEKGELEEFGAPYHLFNKGGRFREMCASAGITEADFI
ncbi:Oligomycin resistance ATP-dependent permease YOR1 [Cyberlindnera fabianii]|uniref:Oligomycin resistance ATP-dependent permease YOR1 n=1 Tax=Cyberlindnera fabianii TaxID=36022 RepID=A0A1V2LBH6_CYBFA|nr:Oligomycin resistance ATP-dependent permease YOR1 [Cyberlindnera fabianii]